MVKSDTGDHLDYLRHVAEQGVRAPLLGGRIGVMWNVLLIPALVAHGLIAQGIWNVPPSRLGLIWMVFGIVGGILTMILVRGLRGKPGAGSTGNKIEAAIWPTISLLIFGFAISIAIGASVSTTPLIMFNAIIPFAFALGALALTVLGRMTDQPYMVTSGLVSAGFMVLTTIFVATPTVYFMAAGGVFFTGLVPSLIQMRREPNYVG